MVAGVKSGRYPQSVKLSERCTAWRVSDILKLAESLAASPVVRWRTDGREYYCGDLAGGSGKSFKVKS